MLDPGGDVSLLEMVGSAFHPEVVIGDDAWFAGDDSRQREFGIPHWLPWAIGRGDPREWDDVGDMPAALGWWSEHFERC